MEKRKSVNTVALGTEFRGRCWRLRRYRGQNLLECVVKDTEYSFRGWNLGDAAGDSLSSKTLLTHLENV